VRMEATGIAVLREAGSAKCRVPPKSDEAILINTSGGLAGGDKVFVRGETGHGATLNLTTQAAERVYRSLGPPASLHVSLHADSGSTLMWLPQETILFDGSALERNIEVNLAEDATFCAVESLVLGRTEMGEEILNVSVRDRWTIKRGDLLLHAEALNLAARPPVSPATLADKRATATLLLVSPDSQRRLEALRTILSPFDGASAWNGKLVARFMAKDGFHLRKTLIQALCLCVGRAQLPKCWTF
jgi:urease accessory protein